MKVRQGFVSNSSSSSFILMMKGDWKELSKKMSEYLKISKESPVYSLGAECVEILNKNSESANIKDMIADEEISIEKGLELQNYVAKGFKVYTGTLSDEEGGLEAYMCDTDLNINTDDLILEHEGGY